MNFKRLTAAALAAVITLTSAIQGYAMRSAAEETGTQPSVSGNDMNIEGTNSFGKMFASELSAKQAEQLENNGCNIFSVEMDGTTATVSYQTAVDCTLVIGIYDESGTTLYATGTAEVTPDERETTVTIETDEMPQYFYIKGYLADSFLLNPLCTVYECPNYTQEMQDFFAKTVDDFDEEKVINFDEDKTNNFAVYSESTIVIPENEGYNIVTSADDENDAYVIENADKNVLALQEGDIFAYEYGENELLIVKIGTIAVDGTTVTITGVETDMDEVFEFVRIETEGDLTDAEASANPEIVDTEEAAEVRTNAPSQMPLAKANDVESGIESSAELTFSFEGEYKKDSNKMQDTGKKDKDGKPIKRQVSALSSDAKINGSASLKVAFRTKVYSSWSYSYAEMELSYEGKLNLNASVNVNFTLDFETLTFKLLSGAVTVNLTPQLILKLQAEVDFNGRWWGSVGGRASLENKKISVENISKSPQHSIENKMDGSIYIGLNLKPQITIFHEKIASANMEGEIGIKLTQKRELSYDSTVDYSQEKKLHDCTWCYDGDIFLCGNFRFNIELFGHQSDDKYLIGSKDSDAEKKIADYYWSVDRGEFAMKECPHQFYRLQFSVYDTNQKPLEGVRIILTAFGDYIKEISTDGVISSDSASSAIMTTSESGKAAAFINVSEPIIIGVHYTKDGYKPLTGISHKLTIDKNGVLNVDKQPVSDSLEVELEPKNAVQFSVTDEAGEPIEGVEITIGEDMQTTDADGNLLWTGLEPGEYSAAFHKDGLIDSVENFTLGEETLAVEVVMKKPVDWKSAYQKTLNDYKSNNDCSYAKWDLQDLDNDGIPELLISEDDFHVASVIYYYYENGEAKLLTEDNGEPIRCGVYGTILICPEKNLLRCDNINMGYFSSDIYKYESKKFVRLFYSYDDEGAVGETKASYHINGEEVTKEEYDAECSLYNNLNWISAGRKYDFDDFSALESNTAEDINGYSAYIAEDGSLYTWGYDGSEQLGDDTTESKSVPTKIEISTGNTATVSLNTSTPVTATSGETTSPQTSLTDLIPDTVYNYYILYSDAEDKLLTSANIQYITQFVSSSDGTAEIDTGETPITEDAVMLAVPAVMTADEPDSTLGDVNGDGTIDTSDAAAILVEIASLGAGSGASFTDAQLTAADINQSGALETSDAAAILSYIAALGAGNEDVKLEDFG